MPLSLVPSFLYLATMCGIAGIISPHSHRVSREQLKQMTDAIAHRGPEGDDFWINADASVGLGHRRLSIIDLTQAAAQPMHYLERFSIVYNGEIYNYLELKKELQQQGYAFFTQSDTEVILAAYDCWREDCVKHFDGMFAFAIWDEKRKHLYAARDRFGEKPFYYLHEKETGSLWFASEMKAFYAAGFKKQQNEKLLLLFLTNGFTSDPSEASITFDKQIRQLPPAHFMVFQTSPGMQQTAIEPYWDIDKNAQQNISAADAVEKFSALFKESIDKRFRSDVPVGTSLSGGLDSSSIAAVASSIAASSNSYKCFSAVFPGFQKDESRFSQRVAQQFKLQQYVTVPGVEDFATDLPRFLHHQDEPVGSASVYAQYRVYQLAKQEGIKVLLDGQGADELLAGYNKHLHWYLQELVHNKPGSLRTAIGQLKKNKTQVEWGWKNYVAAWFPKQAAAQLEKRVQKRILSNTDISPEFRKAYFDPSMIRKPVVRTLNDILYFDTRRFGLNELLRYADRNSMAHGCEVRLPYLSHTLAEFCFSLPAELKIRDGYSKWILRKSMQSSLPQEICWRTDKIGFEPPQKEWMGNRKVMELIQEAKRNLVSQHILRPEAVDKKIQPHESHVADNVDWWYLSAGSLPG
ncbi:MAG: asparagine synthase (glutamine-hydrolyzing) [Chitinophagaceae bacterium]